MYADRQLLPWRDALGHLFDDLQLFDAHTHTGENDPDGFTFTAAELTEALEPVDARAVVFTLHEPHGYSAANDRILAEAAASGGRLVPFCRLDPADDPAREAERCLDAGARGIKLHPRAERFRLEEPETEPIFKVANERRVPVIVHAGRGIPALGRDALDLSAKYPDTSIILAHAGVCDLAWIWRHVPDHPNLLFDTAWWNAVDMLTLFALVPPGQIVFASDAPYGTPLHAALIMLRCGLQAGLTPAQLAVIAGPQLERLLAGESPLELGPAPGEAALSTDILLARVHSYIVTAFGRLLAGDGGDEYLALTRLACEVGDDAPQAPVCRSVIALIDRYEQGREHPPTAGEPAGARRFPGLHLLVMAAIVALTPDVAVPDGLEEPSLTR